ncbi:hypothetical protein C8Q80DRAFT_1187632 [Daedaleopsis nitida]|nr:hypothetical protein C8Q80DRAFT_1187632 [Daedaleopsis nitida]
MSARVDSMHSATLPAGSTVSYLVRLSLLCSARGSSVAQGLDPNACNMPFQTPRATESESDFSFTSLPDIRQCVLVTMTWSGGTPPYIVSIVPSASTRALYRRKYGPSISIEPETPTGSYRWTPDYPDGTRGQIVITDSISNTPSALFIVSGSTDSSCLDSDTVNSRQDPTAPSTSVENLASNQASISPSPASTPLHPLFSTPSLPSPLHSTEPAHLLSINTSTLRSSSAISATGAPAAPSLLPSTPIDTISDVTASSTTSSTTSTVFHSVGPDSQVQATTSTRPMGKAAIAVLSTALCTAVIAVLAIVLCVRRRRNIRALREIHAYPSDHWLYHSDADQKTQVHSPSIHSDSSSRSYIDIREPEVTEASHLATATGSPLPVIVQQYAGDMMSHPVADDHQELIAPQVGSSSKVRVWLRARGMGGTSGRTERLLLPTTSLESSRERLALPDQGATHIPPRLGRFSSHSRIYSHLWSEHGGHGRPRRVEVDAGVSLAGGRLAHEGAGGRVGIEDENESTLSTLPPPYPSD